MSSWPASKAKRVRAALERIGWRIKRTRGSHVLLGREGWPDYEFAFHDADEIGPKMLAKIAKHTDLKPEDLYFSFRRTVVDVKSPRIYCLSEMYGPRMNGLATS